MGKQEMVEMAAVLMELPYEKAEFICRMIFRVAENLGITNGSQSDTEKGAVKKVPLAQQPVPFGICCKKSIKERLQPVEVAAVL